MTGICGVTGSVERGELEKIASRLTHRGAQVDLWAPAAEVQFAWRFEPEAGSSRVDRAPLMFTGTLLNRDEIAALVGRQATTPSLHSDAELIWQLYLARGIDAFAALNGQFAVALYDARSGSLVLAADRWATQPLYFSRVGARWVFSTEYRALLALPDMHANVDRDTVAYLQRTKYLPTRKTLLQGVHVVAPGETVRIHDGSCEVAAYQPLTLDIREDDSQDTLASELRGAILRATERLVSGHERVGIALSAGLDSTLTLGALRAVAPGLPIHTWFVTFDRDDPDLALAAESATHFRTIHREIVLAPEDLPRLLPGMVWAMEDPCAREEMLVYYVLAQEAAQEVPLLLYGHMADVLFGGMPRHMLISLAARLPPLRAPLLSFYDYTQTGREPGSLPGRLLARAYYRGCWVPPPHVRQADDGTGDERIQYSKREPLNSALLRAITHPTEVSAIERLHSYAGLRFGSLFHDREVAQWAFRVPDRLKIRGRQRKYILRSAARGILPPHLAARPKGMIRIGQDRRLWNVVSALAADLLAPSAVRSRGLFDPNDIASLLNMPDSPRARRERFYRLWTLLLTELWCRTFIDGAGAQYEPATAPCRHRENPGGAISSRTRSRAHDRPRTGTARNRPTV